ncbi:hypothetical protein GQ44DRAFT_703369 [Phaeosphaeriaceae sp. PMI808]|nr:hypothetical protein GQ44DRAFT_703369 [Phaeosphaeriaceae sp. PMI808]
MHFISFYRYDYTTDPHPHPQPHISHLVLKITLAWRPLRGRSYNKRPCPHLNLAPGCNEAIEAQCSVCMGE